MRRVAERLAARGHRVVYVTLHDGEECRAQIDGVDVRVLSRGAMRAGESGPESTPSLLERLALTIRRLRSRGVSSVSSVSSKHPASFGNVARYRGWALRTRLQTIARELSADLIHCNSSLPDPLVSALAGGDLGVPVVVRVGGRYWYLRHQRMSSESDRRVYVEQLRFVFGSVDCVAFNGHSLRQCCLGYLEELGIETAGEQVVLDSGVASPAIEAAHEPRALASALDGDSPWIACVGKLKSDSKRQDVLIRAVALLPRGARLALAGDGPTRARLEELAREEGVAERVLFLGNLQRSEVFQLLGRADVFAHATDFEGSSKAVAEAMVAAKPVVVSDIPALREHVRHDDNGLLAANEPGAFADQLTRLLVDRELAARLGASARRYAALHFDPERRADEYERLFGRLVERRRGGAVGWRA
jgi:glycosyltransferase involved in cell wall biosynthesis